MRFFFIVLLLPLASCQREARLAQVSPGAGSLPSQPRIGELQPGGHLPDRDPDNPYEGNYQAIAEGQRLFSWFNCSGCHSPGLGGAIGPALIDDQWVYGNRPANIYDTIVRGRPNGMPAFGGKIPSYQIWQIVTFIRSRSAQKTETPQ